MNLRTLSDRIKREVARHLRNGNFEHTPGGILVDRRQMKAMLGGVFQHTLYRADGSRDVAIDPNRVVGEALTNMLNVWLHGGVQNTAWYIGLYSGAVIPADGWTGANWASLATEFTAYAETTRVEWQEGAAANKAISNSGREAMFTFSGTNNTVRGAVLCQAPAKGAQTGLLVAATNFAAARTGLSAPDQLGVSYTLTAADAST